MMGYYVQLFSPHGLIRYDNPEIGKDNDTGGQVKYVLELLKTLSENKQIRKVDLFTRRIADKRVHPDYAIPVEQINDKARIIRISCGGPAYRRKENLWNYLDEFTDKTIRFIEQEDDYPDWVHGHYADGNYIALQLSKIYGIPFMATGHSLGHNKKNTLLQQNILPEKLNNVYKIDHRIQVEETILQNADLIITSTHHEIESQYAAYKAAAKASFQVIPPGINMNVFYPYYRIHLPSYKLSLEQEQVITRLSNEIDRFLFYPSKPLIVSIGRADKRKNFEAIIRAYGEDKELQAMANLAIFAGVRKDITQMPEEEQEILTNLLLLMDKYDLYGKMAIPKKNDPQQEVPEIYRIAARRKGVFVNATPRENFGLTIIESASCGLPVIASPFGGPKEILKDCKNGLLVNVEDPKEISGAIKKIIADEKLWQQFSENGVLGVNKNYSWQAHVENYIGSVKKILTNRHKPSNIITEGAYGKRLAQVTRFFITDIDGTLVDGPTTTGLEKLIDWIKMQTPQTAFGLASGRNIALVKQAIETYRLPVPDIIISSAGAEIYYSADFIADSGWENHISFQWKRNEIEKLLANIPQLKLQETDAQREFKLSYYTKEGFTQDDLHLIYKQLYEKNLRAKILLTQNRYLDILPFRAGKGNAIRFLSNKWKTPLEQFITAGNSGNDIDMLKGKVKGIVVSNYSRELEPLKKLKNIYFSPNPLASGVLDGIRFYETKTIPVLT